MRNHHLELTSGRSSDIYIEELYSDGVDEDKEGSYDHDEATAGHDDDRADCCFTKYYGAVCCLLSSSLSWYCWGLSMSCFASSPSLSSLEVGLGPHLMTTSRWHE